MPQRSNQDRPYGPRNVALNRLGAPGNSARARSSNGRGSEQPALAAINYLALLKAQQTYLQARIVLVQAQAYASPIPRRFRAGFGALRQQALLPKLVPLVIGE
jgi:hypothetical protein